ncbi:hypothetical protein [Mesorhizobium sp. B2-8-9]|uniref:hypothetical protein n=1 Tax=Mesorhizobium sp. B2-8-9 TaxID=2589899 RepID=UPI001128CEEC|nr:hypothetical protein [Mesorhizobium sp. B2-8-9]TPI86395.1 hypothetical protein FJ423_00805 [Mesorhizobium sp. B2-8-9]
MRGSRGLHLAALGAMAGLLISEPPRRPVATSNIDPDAPPRRLRLSDSTRDICKRVGVRFNGIGMPGNVYAYDVDEDWIELKDGRRLRGLVEPYWKQSTRVDPAPSIIDPHPSFVDPPVAANVDRLSAAEEKRARKAAKRAASLR